MLKLKLAEEILERYLVSEFGGLSGLVDEEECSKEESLALKRSTVYRWISKGLPLQKETIHRFMGQLDLDLLAVLDIEGSGLREAFPQMRRAFHIGAFGKKSKSVPFEAIFEKIYPSTEWPNLDFSKTYYGRDWYTFEFNHDAEAFRNVYCAVSIEIDKVVSPSTPLGIYIAHKPLSFNQGLWLPYGALVHRENETLLFHERGDQQRRDVKGNWRRLVFETHLGSGSGSFRICSLHPFSASVEVPSTKSNVLRFTAT